MVQERHHQKVVWLLLSWPLVLLLVWPSPAESVMVILLGMYRVFQCQSMFRILIWILLQRYQHWKGCHWQLTTCQYVLNPLLDISQCKYQIVLRGNLTTSPWGQHMIRIDSLNVAKSHSRPIHCYQEHCLHPQKDKNWLRLSNWKRIALTESCLFNIVHNSL